MNKFKVGDEVKFVDICDTHFGKHAIIDYVDMNDYSNFHYCCKTSSGTNPPNHVWRTEESLQLVNEQKPKSKDKRFTISVKNHKRINLKFEL